MESEPSETTEQERDRDIQRILNCPIFQSNLEGSSITNCGHPFCSHCIFLWLEKNTTCPSCSAPISSQEVSEQSSKELLDNVILMKDREIDQLGAIIMSRDATIQQLSDDSNKHASELYELTLQLEDMQGHIEIKEEENEQLKDMLHDMHNNILPERDHMIAQLHNQIAELSDQLSALYQRTICISELVAVPETKLHRSLEQLQRYYDREYRTRIDVTAEMEVLLRTRLEEVMTELCKDPDRGDQLALVIKTYTSLVEENSSLHRIQKTLTTEIKHLKTVIHGSKARTYELERRYQFDYMLEE